MNSIFVLIVERVFNQLLSCIFIVHGEYRTIRVTNALLNHLTLHGDKVDIVNEAVSMLFVVF